MSDTETLIKALRILARDIESGDGVANAAIAEAADRLQEHQERIQRLEEVAAKLANCARFLGTWNHDSMDVLRMKDEAMDELQNLEKEKP